MYNPPTLRVSGSLAFKHILSQSHIISHCNYKEIVLDPNLFLRVYCLKRTLILLPFCNLSNTFFKVMPVFVLSISAFANMSPQ